MLYSAFTLLLLSTVAQAEPWPMDGRVVQHVGDLTGDGVADLLLRKGDVVELRELHGAVVGEPISTWTLDHTPDSANPVVQADGSLVLVTVVRTPDDDVHVQWCTSMLRRVPLRSSGPVATEASWEPEDCTWLASSADLDGDGLPERFLIRNWPPPTLIKSQLATWEGRKPELTLVASVSGGNIAGVGTTVFGPFGPSEGDMLVSGGSDGPQRVPAPMTWMNDSGDLVRWFPVGSSSTRDTSKSFVSLLGDVDGDGLSDAYINGPIAESKQAGASCSTRSVLASWTNNTWHVALPISPAIGNYADVSPG